MQMRERLKWFRIRSNGGNTMRNAKEEDLNASRRRMSTDEISNPVNGSERARRDTHPEDSKEITRRNTGNIAIRPAGLIKPGRSPMADSTLRAPSKRRIVGLGLRD
jgi:hypothetical protein